MTTNILEYKGFIAHIQFSADDDEFYGRVQNIERHVISFGGKTVAELKKHFKEAVNGYLAFCAEEGIEPKKSLSGRITFRTTPQRHAKLAKAAMLSGKRSLNAFIDDVLAAQADKVLSRHPEA